LDTTFLILPELYYRKYALLEKKLKGTTLRFPTWISFVDIHSKYNERIYRQKMDKALIKSNFSAIMRLSTVTVTVCSSAYIHINRGRGGEMSDP